MKIHLTKAEAVAFKARWAVVNRAERKELRATSVGHKLQQLAALMASVDKLGWTESLSQEESEVRIRWNRLRKAYLFKKEKMIKAGDLPNKRGDSCVR